MCIPTFMDFLRLKISSLNRRQSVSELAVILGVHKKDKTHVYGFFGIDLHEIQFSPHPKNPGTHGLMWGNNKTKIMQPGIVVCLFIICIGN